MKRIRAIGAYSGAIGTPWVRQAGQAIAYLCIPLSLVAGPTIESPLWMLVPCAVVAAFGVAAVFRGATVPELVVQVGYFFLGWYVLLTAIELVHGDLVRFPRPIAADFLATYFVLLAFPFFVIGLRELRAERAALEWSMAATVAIATVWSLVGFFVFQIARPGGFNGLNSISFGMVVLLWGLFLLAGSLSAGTPDWRRLVPALVALIPVVLAGSKLVWICAAIGYGLTFVWWAVSARRWVTLAVTILAAAAIAVVLAQADFVQIRLTQMAADVGSYLATGDTSGTTFGIRFAAATSGFYAFLDQPLLGYGLADVKVAALMHRPESFADFSYLWHLHNQYVTHLVAFGIPGLLFLVSLFGTFLFVGWRTADPGVRRFAVSTVVACAVYMGAELLFPRTPLYGTIFFLLAVCIVIVTREEPEPRQVAVAAA